VTAESQVAVTDLDERYQRLRLPQPRLMKAIVASMRRYGQLSPVVVCERKETLAVVDGFKRVAAMRQLGQELVAVRCLPLCERAAVAAVYGLNFGARRLVDLEEALVVRELVREQGLTQADVGSLLSRDKSWVSRRLMLIERLCEQVQDDVRVGLIPVSVAREVARLPHGNQPEVAASVRRHGLTSRDAARLVRLFERTSDRGAQEDLLDAPRTALETAHGPGRAAPHDPRLDKLGNRVRRQALSVSEGLVRLEQMLPQDPGAQWSRPERQILGQVLDQVGATAMQLGHQLADAARAIGGADASP